MTGTRRFDAVQTLSTTGVSLSMLQLADLSPVENGTSFILRDSPRGTRFLLVDEQYPSSRLSRRFRQAASARLHRLAEAAEETLPRQLGSIR